MTGRIVIDDIRPRTPTRQYPAKASVGEKVVVSAVIFKDGHDILAAQVRLGPASLGGHQQGDEPAPMVDLVNGKDEWAAVVRPGSGGLQHIVIEAWTDRHATWAHKTRIK
ncbi:MAG: DUF3416 domain-containing protein, partial [Actinomycetota bacterium]|nr:DUF3416 domain-containing protein [Actinomycetota bacterium]